MISRRSFVKGASLAAAGVLLPRFPAFGSGVEFTELRRGVGMWTGRGGTLGWLVRDDALVVVDSQFPEQAAEFLGGLSERSGRRIDFLVNTHHHGDHTAGNGVIGEKADHIVAHQNVPGLQRMARREDAPEPVVADMTYANAWRQELGDEVLSLSHHGAAHTGGDSVVHFQQADVVHMGDLVFNRRPPFIDRNGGASIAGWIDTLETVHDAHTDDTLFIFGHAGPGWPVTGPRSELLVMRDFLGALFEYVQAGIAEGKDLEALTVNQIPGFPDHFLESSPTGIPRNIRAAYEELTESN